VYNYQDSIHIGFLRNRQLQEKEGVDKEDKEDKEVEVEVVYNLDN
jgi:hypothetical protein